MSEMIERVMKSMEDTRHLSSRYAQARAVIEAMREPTGPMVNEGSIYAEGETLVEACENTKRSWHTMIAAALRQEQGK